ncbi:hypothetical protein EJ03DRAFT_114152 [Teratosphaeria nubilosa]|uniref:F-box domain-containing protein n=1 Tax=Teratosphaeria nubilosa TaxID=161662 RepID=A0A6G1L723_9PEZI|nr:hypothetical protein EJ03DRAFT_114152 [Teratosphaeria nubilosa]
MPGDSSTCQFLQLPPELRNNIYEHLLVYKYGNKLSQRIIAIHCMPPLLRTCRQIKAEASAIYYSQNDFNAIISSLCPRRDSGVWSWFERTGAENCALIRHLKVRWFDLHASRQFTCEWARATLDDELSGNWTERNAFFEEKMKLLAAGDFKALLEKGVQVAALEFASDDWCYKDRLYKYAQAWARAMEREKANMMK